MPRELYVIPNTERGIIISTDAEELPDNGVRMSVNVDPNLDGYIGGIVAPGDIQDIDIGTPTHIFLGKIGEDQDGSAIIGYYLYDMVNKSATYKTLIEMSKVP